MKFIWTRRGYSKQFFFVNITSYDNSIWEYRYLYIYITYSYSERAKQEKYFSECKCKLKNNFVNNFLEIRPGQPEPNRPYRHVFVSLISRQLWEWSFWNTKQKMRTFLYYDLSNFQSNQPHLASIKPIEIGKIPNNFWKNWLLWASEIFLSTNYYQ